MAVPVIYFDLGNTLVHGPANNRQPFGDAQATIQELWQRGYRIGLLSDQLPGTTETQVREKLDSYGLQSQRFDLVTISSEFDPPIYKPDAAIFDAAIAKAGHAAASDETVFVTETLTHIEAARNLGWRAIHKPFEASCTPQSGECVEDLDDLLALFPPLPVDIWIRDAAGDPGEDQYAGSNFWNSPDLWIRNQADGGTEHQNPEAGADNWFYTRVRNRGIGIARVVWVGYCVQEWVGTQFVYPDDYQPWIQTSEFTPFAFGLDIEPGGSRVVSGRWPAAAVPAAGTHACWLAAAHATDDMPGAGAHVWEHNNLAQKNLVVVDAVPDDPDGVEVVLGNRAIKESRYYRLELHRSGETRPLAVSLHGQTRGALARLVAAGRDLPREAATREPVHAALGLLFLDAARLELTGGRAPGNRPTLRLEPGSTLDFGRPADGKAPAPARRMPPLALARLVDDGKTGASIVFDTKRSSGIGIALRAHQVVRTVLRFEVPREARPGERIVFDLVQRAADGRIAGGVTLRLDVRARRRRKSVRAPRRRRAGR